MEIGPAATPPPDRQRRAAQAALAVFVLGVALRLPAVMASPWARTAQTHDTREYEALGWQVARHLPYAGDTPSLLLAAPSGAPTAFRAPGLPFLIAGVFEVAGRQPDAARAVLAILGALGAAALCLAVAEAAGTTAGLLAGLGWAAWPGAVVTFYSSSELLAENLAIPCLLLALWCLARGRPLAAAAGGLLTGIAILARTYVLLVLPILILAMLARPPRRSGWRARLAVLVLLALVPPALWAWRNRVTFGDGLFLTTQQGSGFWLGNHDGARGSWDGNWERGPALAALLGRHPELPVVTEPAKSALFAREGFDAVRRRGLLGQARLVARKAVLFVWPFESVHGFQWWLALTLPLAALGLVVALRTEPHEVLAFLLSWLLAVVAATLLFFHDVRIRYTAEPALVALAALAAARLAARGRRRSGC